MADTLQAQVQFADLRNDPAFVAAPQPEQVQYLMEDYLPKQDAAFAKASPQEKQQYINEVVLPQIRTSNVPIDTQHQDRPGVMQGLENVRQGLSNIDHAFNDFAWNIPGQVFNAAKTEYASSARDFQNNLNNPLQSLNPLSGRSAAPLMALEGVRNFAQMPADLLAAGQNVYQGVNTNKPVYNLPSFTDLPIVGHILKQQQQDYPVSDFIAQGAIPAEKAFGFLGGLLKKTKKAGAPALTRAKVKAPGASYGDFGRTVGTRSQGNFTNIAKKVLTNTDKFIQDVEAYTGIDAPTTARKKAELYKKAFDQLEATHKNTNSQALKARIRQAQEKLKAGHQAEKASGKPVKTQRTTLDPNSDTFKAVVKFGKELREEGRVREANVALNQYHPETKAKLFDAIHKVEASEKAHASSVKKQYEADFKKLLAEEKAAAQKQKALQDEIKKTQNLKDKEALQSQKALLKAESKTRQSELKRLKGDIAQRAKAEELETKIRQAQAKSDLSALEKADLENRRRELRQLKGAIQSRESESTAAIKATQKANKDGNTLLGAIEQAAKSPGKYGTDIEYTSPGKDEYSRMADEAKRQGKQGSPQTDKNAGPRAVKIAEIKAEAQAAVKTGELVEFNYSAEGGRSRVNEERIVREGATKDGRTEANQIGGESLDKRQGYRKEVILETGVTKAGDDFMRTVDADGNISTRIISGRGQKSRVNWLRRTGELPPEGFGKGEGSRGSTTAYSSEIKASVNKMKSVLERIKKGESVTNAEIIEAAKPISEKEFIDSMEGADQAKINKIGKKVDC